MNIEKIRLEENALTDLTPLVQNPGIGAGDTVDISDNPLDCDTQAANLDALNNAGVVLTSDCP